MFKPKAKGKKGKGKNGKLQSILKKLIANRPNPAMAGALPTSPMGVPPGPMGGAGMNPMMGGGGPKKYKGLKGALKKK